MGAASGVRRRLVVVARRGADAGAAAGIGGAAERDRLGVGRQPVGSDLDVGSQQPGIAWESAGADERQPRRDRRRRDDLGARRLLLGLDRAAARPVLVDRDRHLRAAPRRRAGCTSSRIADYTPSWARTGPTEQVPADEPGRLRRPSSAPLAQHYAPLGVHDWEIWNEPNNAAFWAPKADPLAYTRVARARERGDQAGRPVGDRRDRRPLAGGRQRHATSRRSTFLASVYARRRPAAASTPSATTRTRTRTRRCTRPSWNTFYETPAVHTLMAAQRRRCQADLGHRGRVPDRHELERREHRRAGDRHRRRDRAVDELDASTDRSSSTRSATVGTDRSDVDQNMGMLDHSGAPKPVFAAVQQLLATTHADRTCAAGDRAADDYAADHRTAGTDGARRRAARTSSAGRSAPVDRSRPHGTRDDAHPRHPRRAQRRAPSRFAYTTALGAAARANARSGVDYVGDVGHAHLRAGPDPPRTSRSRSVPTTGTSRTTASSCASAPRTHGVLTGYGIGLGVIRERSSTLARGSRSMTPVLDERSW